MSCSVVERHGAKPYGFRFSTCNEADPLPDGDGGTLRVEPRQTAESAMHFLGGTVSTIDDVRRRAKADEKILLSNMECNNWAVIVENNNSWRFTTVFCEQDCIVDGAGEVVRRGCDADLVAARKRLADSKR